MITGICDTCAHALTDYDHTTGMTFFDCARMDEYRDDLHWGEDAEHPCPLWLPDERGD